MFENIFGRNRDDEEFKIWLNQVMKDYQRMFESLNKKRDDDNRDKWEIRGWSSPGGFGMTSHTRGNGLHSMDDREMESILNELSRMMSIPRHKTPLSGYSDREPIDKETKLEILNRDLIESIEDEDYEMAAKIRDEIKNVNKET